MWRSFVLDALLAHKLICFRIIRDDTGYLLFFKFQKLVRKIQKLWKLIIFTGSKYFECYQRRIQNPVKYLRLLYKNS